MPRIIRHDSMPRLWWLNPWATALYLHQALSAIKGYADRADAVVDFQTKVIRDQSLEVMSLRRQLDELNDAVVSGRAIIPDATPHE